MLFWVVLGGDLTPRLLVTGILASWMSLVLYLWLLKHAGMRVVTEITLVQFVKYIGLVSVAIFQSAILHSRQILSGRGETCVTTFELSTGNDTAKLLIANAVTLTPGSLTLEVDPHHIRILHYQCSENELNKMRRFVARLENNFK